MNFITHFHWIDIFCLIAFLRISYIASARGLINELIKCTGVLLAVFFSLQYYPAVMGDIFQEGPFSSLSKYVYFISFVVIFSLTLVIFYFIRKIAGVLFSAETYPLWQRWMGLFMGIIRAGLLISVGFFLVYLWPVSNAQMFTRTFSGSFFKKYFKNLAPSFYLKVFPLYKKMNNSEDINEEVKKYYEIEGYLLHGNKTRDRG